MSEPRDASEGLEVLRAGDPARGQEPLGELERARLRQRILAEARTRVAARPRLGLGIAVPVGVAAVLVLVWVAAWSTAPVTPTGATDEGRGSRATGPGVESDERATRRQLQFTTPGGTRIVWDLRRDFRMPTPEGRSPFAPETRS